METTRFVHALGRHVIGGDADHILLVLSETGLLIEISLGHLTVVMKKVLLKAMSMLVIRV